MKTKATILFIMVLSISMAQAQRKTEIGLTGGAARFYPKSEYMDPSLNNSMDNGWGWSAGVFIEDHWKPKIHQIIELNYYNMSSDVYLQKNPPSPWSPYDGTGREPIYGNYSNTAFNQIAISGGIKYFLTHTLFAYPAFEIARTLNPDVEINKTTLNLKLGAGAAIGPVNVNLEYSYGLKHQQTIYDITVPFATTHRNTYLQLKAQVPLYNFKR
ncbi:hypothetical protein MASR2M47_19750 [Draconibacterium sp.]|jgi:hypothetical protein